MARGPSGPVGEPHGTLGPSLRNGGPSAALRRVVLRASVATASLWLVVAVALLVTAAWLVLGPRPWNAFTPAALAIGPILIGWRWLTFRLVFEADRLLIGRMRGPPTEVRYRDISGWTFEVHKAAGASGAVASAAAARSLVRLGVPVAAQAQQTGLRGGPTVCLRIDRPGLPSLHVNAKLLRRAAHVKDVHALLLTRAPAN